MEFQKVINVRRAVRGYKSDPIPEKAMDLMKEAIRRAPTGNNHQSFKVVFVRNASLRMQIAEKACHQAFISEAPVIAVVFSEKGQEFNAAIVTDHMVLAATSEGIGTCWVGWFEREIIESLFPQYNDMVPCILVPMGYANDVAEDKPRKSMDEIVVVID